MTKKFDTSIIIQARLGSKRFPKKTINKLGNHKLIEWVIDRVKKTSNINKVILATTNLKEDKILAKIAVDKKINYYLGDSNNVLKRFYGAAIFYSVKNIVRVCADGPFISHEFIENLISFFASNKCDLAFNHVPTKSFGCADGFGAEIFKTSLLKRILKINISKDQKEHLTKYIWDNEKKFRIKPAPLKKIFMNRKLKYEINYRKDLNYLNKFVKNNNININSSASEIILCSIKK